MPSTLEKLDKNFVSLELTVSPEEIDAALEQAYLRVAKKVSISGFRKGKVPRRVLEAQYGREVLYEEAIDIVVPQAYAAAIEEQGVVPIDHPKFDVVEQFEEGKPFVLKATVEVMPEVKLGEYKGLDVPKPDAVVEAEKVDERLQALRERHSELVVVDRTTLAQGDFAVIDFEGFIDEQAFPGGAAQGQTLEIGGGNFIPGFEDGLVGMEVGTEREIQVTFPEDYHAKELAGKPALFKVSLKEIKIKELPALDDEFAKAMGYESIEKFREELKSKMEEAAQRQAEDSWKDAVVAKAVENAEVDVPETLIKRQADNMLHDFEHNLAYQGLNLETYLQYTEKTIEQIKEEFAPSAVKRAKTELVLEAIAKAEGIDPSEDEVELEVQQLLRSYPPKDQARAKKEMAKPSRREGIKDAIRMDKTVRFLTEQVKSA